MADLTSDTVDPTSGRGIYRPTKADKKIYKGMSVVIAIPCKDYEMSASFARDVGNLIAYSWHNGLRVDQMAVTERMVVHWARNELARECRDYKCPWTGNKFTHILWLDDDHAFTPDLLVCLAKNQHLDVLGALYYGRQKHLPVVYIRDDSDDIYSHYTMITVPAHVIEVDAMGFGGVLMRREILDRLKEPYFKFDNAGEDIYFCAQAKKQGVKIHLDGGYDMGHMADPEVVTRKTYEKYIEDHKAELGPKIEKRTVIGA